MLLPTYPCCGPPHEVGPNPQKLQVPSVIPKSTNLLSLPWWFGLPFLNVEEPKQWDHRKGRETSSCDIKWHVSPWYPLDLKEIGGLVAVCGLSIGHLVPIRIQSIGSNEICGSGRVSLNLPIKGLLFVSAGIGSGHHLKLAGLVSGEIIFGFPPGTVLLADGCIAKLHLHLVVLGVEPWG